MNKRTTDLNDPDVPEGVSAVLREAAQKMYEQQGELVAAWQDKHAGKDWTRIAKILERAADSIDNMLLREHGTGSHRVASGG